MAQDDKRVWNNSKSLLGHSLEPFSVQQYAMPMFSGQSNSCHALYRSPFIVSPYFSIRAFFQRASHIEFTRRSDSLRISRRCVPVHTTPRIPKRPSHAERSVIGLPPGSQCKFAHARGYPASVHTSLGTCKNATRRILVSTFLRRVWRKNVSIEAKASTTAAGRCGCDRATSDIELHRVQRSIWRRDLAFDRLRRANESRSTERTRVAFIHCVP